MASKYGYRLTRKAADDLDDIVSYIAMELENKPAAAHFLDMLQAAIDEAREFPGSGTAIINEYLPETAVRKKFVGSYIMYYLPEHQERVVQILRVIYGRRNLTEIMQSLQSD